MMCFNFVVAQRLGALGGKMFFISQFPQEPNFVAINPDLESQCFGNLCIECFIFQSVLVVLTYTSLIY